MRIFINVIMIKLYLEIFYTGKVCKKYFHSIYELWYSFDILYTFSLDKENIELEAHFSYV